MIQAGVAGDAATVMIERQRGWARKTPGLTQLKSCTN